MTTTRDSSAQRAERLLRWYPRVWRERYGEEFTALLMEDLTERPRWSGRTVNIMGSGLLARLSTAGLTGSVLDGPEQARASLATLICSVAAFLALGISMWSQLTIGWQWSAPDTTGTTVAIVAMTLAVAIFIALAACAVGPVLLTVVRALAGRKAHGLARPLLLVVVGISMVVVGSRHFGNGWPGTGGHPWSHQGLVPGGIAAFSWASTLSITSYWVHPSALLAFPVAELAWMLASPVALVMIAVGSAKMIRRVHLSHAVLQFEMRLGRVAVATMAFFLLAAGAWVLRGGTGPRGLFDAGSIDRVAIVAMTASLILAVHTIGRARKLGAAHWAT
jgi:hypothetical protein